MTTACAPPRRILSGIALTALFTVVAALTGPALAFTSAATRNQVRASSDRPGSNRRCRRSHRRPRPRSSSERGAELPRHRRLSDYRRQDRRTGLVFRSNKLNKLNPLVLVELIRI